MQRTQLTRGANFERIRGGTGLAALNPETLMLTMVGLAKEQRRMLIDKLPDAADLALGGLVFGQFLGDRPFSMALLFSEL